MALTVIENAPPELILLDVRMPVTDGFEVCRQVKANKKSSDIPILFLSALDEVADKVKGFEAGAVDFITKPFQAEEVLTRVDTHLTLSRLSRNLEQQVAKRASDLKESEERYRSLVEASPVAIVAVQNGKILFSNPAGAQMLGFSHPDKLVGIPAMDLVAPESQQLVIERLKRLESGKYNPTVEIALIRQDGTKFGAESTSVSAPIGGIPTAVIIARDISERQKLEMKLRESEEQFSAFMENTPGVIYIKDENDRHLYTNQLGLKVVGKKREEFIGSRTRDLFPPKLSDRLVALDRKVLSENISLVADEYRHTNKGEARWFRDIKFPIELASGKKLLGGIAMDITEIKQNEQNLQNAVREISDLTKKLEQENIFLKEEIEVQHHHEEIVGQSLPVMEMLNRAEQVAETDSTVLILGETGTGKELLARAIHNLSRRKDNQMIKVNCAALPSTLIESELFGREKGAYTGALSRQIGRFEIADKSTIFLDEIGELPLGLQAKLLRVIQEGQFERLGSPRTISVNVRIIASTNRDLARAVAEGRFREDLYYRLNVFSITAPSLRDRTDDIPLLVWALVKEFEKSMGKTIEKVSKKSIEMLQQYSWPGNIRELRNVVENAMIVSKDKILNLIQPVDSSLEIKKDLTLEAVERNHIIDVLEKTSWRVSGENGAAKLLGLKATTLESRMKKLGISRPK
jgi:PAS domain S-box-containing protein